MKKLNAKFPNGERLKPTVARQSWRSRCSVTLWSAKSPVSKSYDVLHCAAHLGVRLKEKLPRIDDWGGRSTRGTPWFDGNESSGSSASACSSQMARTRGSAIVRQRARGSSKVTSTPRGGRCREYE